MSSNYYFKDLKQFLVSLLLAITFACSGANAQSSSAMWSINGLVLDPQGRPISGATLLVRNTDFTLSRTMTTDESGRFASTFLPVGPYTLQVTAKGFELKKPLRMNVGAASNTNVE